jgi:hypothetical protein
MTETKKNSYTLGDYKVAIIVKDGLSFLDVLTLCLALGIALDKDALSKKLTGETGPAIAETIDGVDFLLVPESMVPEFLVALSTYDMPDVVKAKLEAFHARFMEIAFAAFNISTERVELSQERFAYERRRDEYKSLIDPKLNRLGSVKLALDDIEANPVTDTSSPNFTEQASSKVSLTQEYERLNNEVQKMRDEISRCEEILSQIGAAPTPVSNILDQVFAV